MDKEKRAHDLALAAATVSALHEYDVTILSEKKETRRTRLADFVRDEYEYYFDYYMDTIR